MAPKLKTRRVKLSALNFDAANARLHPPENLAALKASLRQFGQAEPLIVQKATGKVIAGNGRLQVMLDEGWTEADIVELDVDDVKATALGIALNRSGELARWDDATLAKLLETLKGSAPEDAAATGFSEEQLEIMLRKLHLATAPVADDPGPAAEVEKVDALQEKWAMKPDGQLWLIPSKTVPGECHRLLCGDATLPADVERVMGGEVAGLMNTDPPYGIDYSQVKDGIPGSGFTNQLERWGDIEGDAPVDDAGLQAFLESAIRAALPHLSNAPAFYLWHPMLLQGAVFAAAAAAVGILIHRQIVWVKPGLVLTRSGMYHWKHEIAWYGWIKGKLPAWLGDKGQVSVWDVGRDEGHGIHPTQKPVELFTRPILNHLQPGEIAYEPFAGSGSQFVAAEQTGRLCHGIEIDPRYCAVILERLAGMGLAPQLAGDVGSASA